MLLEVRMSETAAGFIQKRGFFRKGVRWIARARYRGMGIAHRSPCNRWTVPAPRGYATKRALPTGIGALCLARPTMRSKNQMVRAMIRAETVR